ncbi:DUF3237 domain-containing protein [Kitasatospora phosalacinea]|uniref:DUF3237 domain-containing protein n=1 Tax=Kitasatospora phosalacinea TaxID=2065 RepID=UPI0035D66471
MTPAPDHAFEIRAHLAPTRPVGHGDGETPEFAPIAGGTVTGPRLTGTVLPGGGDWSSTRGAVCQLDARHLRQAEDGAVIDVVNRGHYRLDPGRPAQYEADGPQVAEPGVYQRTAPPPSSAPTPPPTAGWPRRSSSARPARRTRSAPW